MKKAKQTDIQSRIIRAPMHRDGSVGLLYLRLRVEQADARLRPVRVDLPLCTASRSEAEARALVIIKALRTLGRRVIGEFPLPPIPMPGNQRRCAKKAKPQLPPPLPGAGKWI